jgi:hypothetical protein
MQSEFLYSYQTSVCVYALVDTEAGFFSRQTLSRTYLKIAALIAMDGKYADFAGAKVGG